MRDFVNFWDPIKSRKFSKIHHSLYIIHRPSTSIIIQKSPSLSKLSPLLHCFLKISIAMDSSLHQLLPTIFLSALPLLLFILFVSRSRRKLPYPPGPPGFPVIGNMLMMNELTHRGLARLANKYGGLFHMKMGGLHMVAVSTPDMAREVLQAQDGVFSNRPATDAISYLTYDRADMAFAHYGPFWRQMRKICVMKVLFELM